MRNNKIDDSMVVVIIIVFLIVGALFKGMALVVDMFRGEEIKTNTNIEIDNAEYVKGRIKYSSEKYRVNKVVIEGGDIDIKFKEYYYIIFCDNMSQGIRVRADKKWGEKFIEGKAKNSKGVKFEGRVIENKTTSDNINDYSINMYNGTSDNINVNTDYFIDLLQVKYKKKLLYSAIVVILCIIYFVLIIKKDSILYKLNDNIRDKMSRVMLLFSPIAFMYMLRIFTIVNYYK